MSTNLFNLMKVSLVFLLAIGCTTPIPTSTAALPTAVQPTLTSLAPDSSTTPITNILTQTLTIGDYQYMMECSGKGEQVVLLLGGRAAAWKPIQTEINHFMRTCVFEHMGNSPHPLTAEQIANNVHILLKGAEMTAPYVLVGFSVSGYIARLFTNSYPDEVAGIVLLDSSHEDQNARFFDALPAETSTDCQELKDYHSELQGPHMLQVAPQISLDFDISADEVRSIEGNLGNLPLVVLTAGRSEWPDCFPPEVRKQLDQAWLNMQNDLTSLSTNSTHLIAEESGHSFAEQPAMVIDAIQQVVQTVMEETTSPVP